MTDNRHPNPPALPDGAVGFIATRHDRPERRAIYFPNGGLSSSFGQHEPITQIAYALAERGFVLGGALEAPASPYTGGVWPVLRA